MYVWKSQIVVLFAVRVIDFDAFSFSYKNTLENAGK